MRFPMNPEGINLGSLLNIVIPAITAIIGSLLTFFATNISSKKSSKTQIDSVYIENIKEILDTYRNDIKELKEEIEAYTNENNKLREDIAALQEENKRLQKTSSKLIQQNIELIRSNEEIKNENIKMQRLIEEFKERLNHKNNNIDC